MTPAILALAFGLSIPARPAVRVTDFLDSIGANTAISVRGESLGKTIECVRYLGLRWVRSGNESGPIMADLLELHTQTGAKLSWGLASGGTDLEALIRMGKTLARAGALLAFEGSNEPNNWKVNYQGKEGGGSGSWQAVAALQRDLYKAVKGDPLLKKYPVWSISEGGAEVDNVGLQFLTVPKGAGTDVPDGTRYADYANAHNYFYHPNSSAVEDNKTWNAADPGPACRVDGLYGEYGLTWLKKYKGYSEKELLTLPRVTTETGATIGGDVTEEIHALNLMSLYLDQFKRGWSYTAMYIMRDRTDEGGNQRFGFYGPDYAPRKAAVYLHNLTTILADKGRLKKVGRLVYSIPNQPETVHDLLLQKSDGTFALVVWSERVKGTNEVEVRLGSARRNMMVYDPTLGTSVVQAPAETDVVRLSLTDHPMVVEIPR